MKLKIIITALILFVITGFQASFAQGGVTVVQKKEKSNRALYRLSHRGNNFECRLQIVSGNQVNYHIRTGTGAMLVSGAIEPGNVTIASGSRVYDTEVVLMFLIRLVDNAKNQPISLVEEADVPAEYDSQCLQDCIDDIRKHLGTARADEQKRAPATTLGAHSSPIFIDDIERAASSFEDCIENCRN